MSKTAPAKTVLKSIIAEIPTPFHLYDEAQIRKHARDLNAAFSWNPGFKEYFAVKALPNPYILRILKEEGCGADCASLTELMLAEAIGLSGDGIMFSSNQTPAEEFEYARKLGAIINLDDSTHVDFLKAHGGLPELVCLRLNPGGDFSVNDTVMGTPMTSKFGMTEAQLIASVDKLSAYGVKRFALHSFLASNMVTDDYYPALARILFELAAKINRTFPDINVEMVNLSGGVGVNYLPDGAQPDIFAIGQKVKAQYDAVAAQGGLSGVRIATELGRWMTASAGFLVTTAIHEKPIYRHYIGVDASACDLMRPAMYGAYHHITVAGKENEAETELYDVVGSLCENNDKFAEQRRLPKVGMGDILVIHDTGAHGHSMGYNYNGKLRSAEVLLKPDGSFQLIRRRQTPRDYFSTLDFTGIMDGQI